jgi:membrane associated rhomboid family serine protease
MFIVVPVGMNYRTERLPVVTFSLIGLNTLVWLVTLVWDLSAHGHASEWVTDHLWLTPATSPWYAWVTAMFVHAGFFHLLGNMLFLFLFGCCVEDLIGRWRYLLFYLLGGLVADAVFVASIPLHMASHDPSGGASGAISACMGMYLMLRAEADIEFKYFYFLMFFMRFGAGEFEVPAWMAIGFWFLSDLFWMIWGMFYPSTGGGVGFGAHVGGLLAGAGLVAMTKLSAKAAKKEKASTDILSMEEIKAAAVVSPGRSEMDIPTLYLHKDGAQTGPFTLAEIQTRMAENELDPETLYWTEGMSRWEPVADLADNSSR